VTFEFSKGSIGNSSRSVAKSVAGPRRRFGRGKKKKRKKGVNTLSASPRFCLDFFFCSLASPVAHMRTHRPCDNAASSRLF
jgi:hypothetical protein